MKFNLNNISLLKNAITELDECNDDMLYENEFDENLADYAIAKKNALIALVAIDKFIKNTKRVVDEFDLRVYLKDEDAEYLEEIYEDYVDNLRSILK